MWGYYYSLGHPNGDTPLHNAAENGHFEICQLIIENVTDKNPSNKSGETPLEIATKKGYSNIIQLFTENIDWIW